MSTDLAQPPLPNRLMRSGLAYALAFGGAIWAIQYFGRTADEGSTLPNLLAVLGNALPVGLICSFAMIAVGVILKLRERMTA